MLRSIIVALLSPAVYLAASLALAASPGLAQTVPEGGYSVSNPALQDYFSHRGGQRVLGRPISRELILLGSRVQFFERGVLQQRPDGSVGLLSILDEGLFPYTHVNGLTFPSADPALVHTAPSPADPDYPAKALAFLRANAPDEWEGMKTSFFTTFANAVTYQDAFPEGGADDALVPLINLEMWGLPTSKPSYDPHNGDFVYLRFQRGILHFNRQSGETTWLPVGEYLKAVVTGHDLPPDLDQEARGSRLYCQYDNGKPDGVANPSALPGSNMFAAFEKDGVIVPTPVPTVTPSPTPDVPVATPTPEPMAKPDWIVVEGSEWFVTQTKAALALLPDTVRDSIYRIVEVNDRSHFQVQDHTLHVVEVDAFIPGWRDNPDAQIQWYAGWILHAAVHGEQYWSGRPFTGPEAEQEAFVRQEDFIVYHDSSDGVFTRLLIDVVNGKKPGFGEWSQP